MGESTYCTFSSCAIFPLNRKSFMQGNFETCNSSPTAWNGTAHSANLLPPLVHFAAGLQADGLTSPTAVCFCTDTNRKHCTLAWCALLLKLLLFLFALLPCWKAASCVSLSQRGKRRLHLNRAYLFKVEDRIHCTVVERCQYDHFITRILNTPAPALIHHQIKLFLVLHM